MKLTSARAALALTLAILATSCAGSRVDSAPATGAASGAAAEPAPSPETERLDDQLARLGMLRSEGEQAGALYLLSLENFIAKAKEDPQVPKMILWKGNYYFDQGLYAEAIENYRQLFNDYRQTPYYLEAIRKTALAYARNDELSNAETWYQRLRMAGSDSLKPEARSQLGGVVFRQARDLERSEDYAAAGEAYYNLFKRFPEIELAPAGLLAAGKMKEKLQKWDEAIAFYTKFMKTFYRSPLLSQAAFQEAWCWENKQAYTQAAKRYLNIIRTFPATPEAEQGLFRAGMVFENAGQRMVAGRTFERFVELFPASKQRCEAISIASRNFQEVSLDKAAKMQALLSGDCQNARVKP